METKNGVVTNDFCEPLFCMEDEIDLYARKILIHENNIAISNCIADYIIAGETDEEKLESDLSDYEIPDLISSQYTVSELAMIASASIGLIVSSKTWSCISETQNLNTQLSSISLLKQLICNKEPITYLEAQKKALRITGINFDHLAHNPFYIMAVDRTIMVMKKCVVGCTEESRWAHVSELLMSNRMKKLQKILAVRQYLITIVQAF